MLEWLNSVIQATKRKSIGHKNPHFKLIASLLTGKLNLAKVNKCLPHETQKNHIILVCWFYNMHRLLWYAK